MSTSKNTVIPPPPQTTLAIAGSDKVFPVRRVWCVGRNYLEHINRGQFQRQRNALQPSHQFSHGAGLLRVEHKAGSV